MVRCAQRRGLRRLAVCDVGEVTAPVEFHELLGEEEALGHRPVGLRIEVRVDRGIDEDLCDRRRHTLAQPRSRLECDHRGQVAARAVSHDTDLAGLEPELVGMAVDPLVRAQ